MMRLRGTASVSLLIRCARILGVLIHRSAEGSWRSAFIGRRSRDDELTWSLAHQFRLALEDLGPTFVKLGQLLSARSDITPPLVQHELAKLQDHAPSIPKEQLLTELELSLGSKPQAHFAVLEIAPVACGSIAQVHRATLHNGRSVAVKVRRPGIRDAIDADVRLVGSFAHLVSRVSSRIRAYDPVAVLNEFAALLRAETDFC